MHYKTLIDNSYLGQWDFPLDPKTGKSVELTVAIDGVPKRFKPSRPRGRKMPDGTYAPEPIKRIEIGLRNAKGPIRKKWLSGPATQQTIASLYGNDVENWAGKRITLYVDPEVMMGRDKVGGVRVRNVAPTGPLTEEALDSDVDAGKAAQIDAAKAGAR